MLQSSSSSAPATDIVFSSSRDILISCEKYTNGILISLSGIIRTFDNILYNYEQENYASPFKALLQILKELKGIQNNRCCYIYRRGPKKGTKCLRVKFRDDVKYIGDSCKSHTPKALGQNKELTHIYGDVYLDRDKVVVIKNTEPTKNYNWVLVRKFNRNKGTLTKFSKTVLESLATSSLKQKFDYIIDESKFIDEARLGQIMFDSKEKPQNTVYTASKPFSGNDVNKEFDKYYRCERLEASNESLINPEDFDQLYKNKQLYREKFDGWKRK
ncbi:hypothetical protein CONCODRAFT_9021 [Conidiobolus coronatus NRRL 28638]|uniref:Uncharacterized protein n=1 Tax=Conidiobolus coronatus (strain ATCC 28846 / CBS 209.66 / NRRL 28638) TaxID=796925 RepID=A0A137P1E4_CONC2|nr:hypothetical protein CONCODRAFT_9021 [Conidiobolus coronatus NRRL 28638]|eukprot:KXN68691.1 hypothetical protein CONCODRAFT_9021 [Conidiobolus coronatus NRRL 28638]